jgi:hypothetical protein
MSEWGAIPDDFDYEFNPIGSPSDKDKADLAKNKTESILSVYNAGVFGKKTALKELREMQEATGMYSNITDEMIDQADDNTNQGESFGDLFGGNAGGAGGDVIDEVRPVGTEAPNRSPIQKLFSGLKQKTVGTNKGTNEPV